MEERTFSFEGETISYMLDRGKRKHAYISIGRDGACIVKVPLHAKESFVQLLLNEKSPWILQKMNEITPLSKPPLDYKSGEFFPLWGREYPLVVTLTKPQKPEQVLFTGKEFSVFVKEETEDAVKRALKDFYQAEAEKKARQYLNHWEEKTGLYATELKIKWMTGSWGRCRSSGGISINAHLAAYPEESLSYVVLHEVCHLRHMNHSKDFWAMVAKEMPHYDKCRKELNKPRSPIVF